MSVKGGKEQRNAILQKLLRILWAGNVAQAAAYLRGLDKALLRSTALTICAVISTNTASIFPAMPSDGGLDCGFPAIVWKS